MEAIHNFIYDYKIRTWFCEFCGCDQRTYEYAEDKIKNEFDRKCKNRQQIKADLSRKKKELRDYKKQSQTNIFDLL